MLGRKIGQTQIFTEKGRRLVVTLIRTGPCYVTQIKSAEKDGYGALQLGFDEIKLKHAPKPLRGHIHKAGSKRIPRFLREVRLSEKEKQEQLNHFRPGAKISLEQVFQVGERVKIAGISKGKGFAGVVKRWGFKGGQRTHGQSDRQRAPGSIGQTTTPGRVFKGKKMAGRMGGKRVTISGLKVLAIDQQKNILTVAGLVPGSRGGLLEIYPLARQTRSERSKQNC